MNVILFGPPGSGKGTQANKIVKVFNLHKFSAGDLLREEIKNQTDIGKKIKDTIDKGQFVSDEIMNDLIIKTLTNDKINSRLIFDGYPRNLNQAKNLNTLIKKYGQKISFVFSLNVEKKILIKRLLGREICSNCNLIFNKYYNQSNATNHACDPKFLVKRSDDNENTIASRFETYSKKTLPILSFYREQKLLHDINGKNEIEKIFEEIRAIMAPLQAWLCKLYLYK